MYSSSTNLVYMRTSVGDWWHTFHSKCLLILDAMATKRSQRIIIVLGKCLDQHNLLSFDQIFLKLAGKWDRHKILNKFKNWSDSVFKNGVMTPLLPKLNISDFVSTIAILVLMWSSWNLQIILTDKIPDKLESSSWHLWCCFGCRNTSSLPCELHTYFSSDQIIMKVQT